MNETRTEITDSARPPVILGVSAFYHDSAACLVREGRIVAAAQEERFTRKKNDSAFPKHAARYCLSQAGISTGDLTHVAFYEKPFLKFDRLLHSYLAFAPRGLPSFLKAMPLWIKDKIWLKANLARELDGFHGSILFPEHHESHAASAFYPSPFQEAAFLTVDGVGEWTTTSFGIGRGSTLEMLGEQHFPHSLGLLYSAFTHHCGFKVNSGEHKLMGLAPFGQPRYRDLILQELMDLKADGSFRLNMRYLDHGAGLIPTRRAFDDLFGGRARVPEAPITQREMDLARSIQEVTSEILLRMARHVRHATGMKHLCLAGGVALNAVATGLLARQGIFDRIWIQPAAGDAGGALGAALLTWHQVLQNPRRADGVHDTQRGSFLGPDIDPEATRTFLQTQQAVFIELTESEIPERIADLIASQNVVGWAQGRMEFGPRALGARSILADARSPKMQQWLNLQIKFRESFRPFAPSVLRERVADYFDVPSGWESPYMMFVAPISDRQRPSPPPREDRAIGLERLKTVRSTIPAVTHVDGSARIQTVTREQNPLFYELLKKLEEKHQIPLVINTSFNVRGEPLVCAPEDAFGCFMTTGMDYLLLGRFLLEKAAQKSVSRPAPSLRRFVPD